MNLEDLKVASPCHEAWEKMTGDERTRHCAKCKLSVYNISGMTRQEAEAFVSSQHGAERTCIRFHRRFDGTVITQDCPVGIRKRRLVLLGLTTVATAAVGALIAIIPSPKPSAGASTGAMRGAYEGAKDKLLNACDTIGHKYHIPGLCNCRAVMGMMIARPTSGGIPPMTLPPETPVADPFAAPPTEASHD